MRGAALWRASFGDASLTAVLEDGLKEDAISKEDFAVLQAAIMKGVPDILREEALEREILNWDIFGPEGN
jgi:hypothetical protein